MKVKNSQPMQTPWGLSLNDDLTYMKGKTHVTFSIHMLGAGFREFLKSEFESLYRILSPQRFQCSGIKNE